MAGNEETHLGDGLYASIDGGMIKLRAPHVHRDTIVYLEPEVFVALIAWAKCIGWKEISE